HTHTHTHTHMKTVTHTSSTHKPPLFKHGTHHTARFVCVCVCVCERERERERESVCVFVCVYLHLQVLHVALGLFALQLDPLPQLDLLLQALLLITQLTADLTATHTHHTHTTHR